MIMFLASSSITMNRFLTLSITETDVETADECKSIYVYSCQVQDTNLGYITTDIIRDPLMNAFCPTLRYELEAFLDVFLEFRNSGLDELLLNG